MFKTIVVVLNWNGSSDTIDCLESLNTTRAIVVDNGSTDNSVEKIRSKFPKINILQNKKNLGFAGGINTGIREAIKQNCDYVAIINNDAVAHDGWLSALEKNISGNPRFGIVTSKILSSDGSYIDSTGEMMTNWGLPYPRGRDSTELDKYDSDKIIFAASGGASIYRVEMLKQVGLFDEDFFAYYEDVDLSFRARLQGWEVGYEPKAVVYHKIGASSAKIKGFTTFQTIKNLPWLYIKNMPSGLIPKTLPRFLLAYCLFIASAVSRKQGIYALKGLAFSLFGLPKKFLQRLRIQSSRNVNSSKIWSLIVCDLPPNATRLIKVRQKFWKMKGKRV